MIKKLAIGISCMVCIGAAAALAGCGDVDYNELYADKVKVEYVLEGGKYLNSTTSVSHYYDYKDNLTIIDLNDERFSKDGVTRDGGFTLEGWYKTKTTGEDGKAVYSDKWNFATDTVKKEGVTLYAKWEEPIIYSFDFIYFENGEEKIANSLKVNAGDKLGDVHTGSVLTYANYSGHTAIEVYYDKDFTRPFDDTVTHPGGEVSTAVKLYAKYIEGSYTLVSTAAQLRIAKNGGIYLLNDIDMDGAKISFDNCKQLVGNGFKISNFTVDYSVGRFDLVENLVDEKKDALCIALFGNPEGVEVKDVTFENITVTVDTFLSDVQHIYVAPLAVKATNSKFENVKVTGTFGYTAQTEGAYKNFDSVLQVETEKGIIQSNNSTETNCEYDITFVGKID